MLCWIVPVWAEELPFTFRGAIASFLFCICMSFFFLNCSNLCRLCSSGSAALRGSVGEAIRQLRTFPFLPALRLLQAPMTGSPPVGAGLHPAARPLRLGATATACSIGPGRAVKHPWFWAGSYRVPKHQLCRRKLCYIQCTLLRTLK